MSWNGCGNGGSLTRSITRQQHRGGRRGRRLRQQQQRRRAALLLGLASPPPVLHPTPDVGRGPAAGE